MNFNPRSMARLVSKTLGRTRTLRVLFISASIIIGSLGIAFAYQQHVASAGTTYYFSVNRTYWDGWSCTGGYLAAGTFFGSCDASTVGQSYSTVQCLGNYVCGSLNDCGNIEYTEVQCLSQTTCTPDSSCAASTPKGSTCTDSCGNSYPGTLDTYTQGYYQATYVPTYAQSYYEAAYTPTYSQSYYQSSYAPTYSESYYQSYYQSSYAPAYSEASYAPSCTSPTVSITATPSRVKSGQTSTLTVTASGITGTCTVTGPGVSQTYNASSCNVSGTITTPAITARSNYTVSCDSGTATAKVSVSIPFGILEF